MRKLSLLLAVMVASIAAGPQDDLVRARQLYNQQLYNLAIDSATAARRAPQLADTATLIIARALLERFRKESDPADLTAARTELQQIRPAGLTAPDQLELIIALGEVLYLDDQAGAAAEEFEMALERVDPKSPTARERILDWWASAIDRQAQQRSGPERPPLYARIIDKMEEELRRDTASAAASYWLVAGARGNGDLERAWDAAMAGWARASLTGERRIALRADLDQIVTQAIIPERARLLSPAGGAAPIGGLDARRVGRAQANLERALRRTARTRTDRRHYRAFRERVLLFSVRSASTFCVLRFTFAYA